MRNLIVTSIMVLSILTSGVSQKTFEARLILKNSANHADTLYFGTANDATRYIDSGYGEFNILNAPVDSLNIDARFSDRFAIYDSNGNYQFDNGNIKMGVSPTTFESKKQFIDPTTELLMFYHYYEINIFNAHWPIELTVSETINSNNEKLSNFILTSWADPSRWFDVGPLCGATMYYPFNSDSSYHFQESDLCEFVTENEDTVHLLFIGISNNTVSINDLSLAQSLTIKSTAQGFDIPIEIFNQIDDWELIDVLGSSIQYEYRNTDFTVQITPINKTNGLLILTSEKWISAGNDAIKTALIN